jgi:hypothetical protein
LLFFAIQSRTRAMSDDPYIPVSYAHRAKPFSLEAEFRFKPDHLSVAQGKRSGNFPYRDIMMIRLLYKPKNTTNEGYEAKIYRRDKHTASLSNISWKGLIDLERKDAQYRAFIEELVSRVQAANPDVVLQAGMPVWLHRITAAAGLGAVGIMLVVGFQAVVLGSWQVGVFAVALAAYFCWWASRYISRNRPRSFTAKTIPEDVVPKRQ